MTVSVETYLRRGKRKLEGVLAQEGVRWTFSLLRHWAGGFLLSAAALAQAAQPIAMGFCCAQTGWHLAVAVLGAMLGYRVFWGSGQGTLWAAMGLLLALIAGGERGRRHPQVISSMAACTVAAIGLVFRLAGWEDVSFGVYLLRVAVAAGTTVLFPCGRADGSTAVSWLAKAALVLALASLGPWQWLNAGVMACGFFSITAPLPAGVLAGLAVDLAGVSRVSLTAVACIGGFLRLLPIDRRLRCVIPGAAALVLMGLCGEWDLFVLPSLVLGGSLSLLFPGTAAARRRGDTGLAQVRLELASGVMAKAQQLLLETAPRPIDEEALLERARGIACGSCALRESCRERLHLTTEHLHRPSEFQCRRPGPILEQLRLGREQLYALRASRSRQAECRAAMAQQYRFQSQYLQFLADGLPRGTERRTPLWRIRVSVRSRSREAVVADRCQGFHGQGCSYFVLLADGMGRGMGAASDAEGISKLLQQLLTAGYAPEQALRTVNSLLVLRGQAGAVTLDLAQIRLDTGRVRLYKWGAAPSWRISREGAEMLGSGSAPPGRSVEGDRETVVSTRLDGEQTLVLLSDGVRTRDLWQGWSAAAGLPTGDLADQVLRRGSRETEDDATAVVIRLTRKGSA